MMAADEREVIPQAESAIRRVDPSALSTRSSLVGLRSAKHPSHSEYEAILTRLVAQQLRRNAVFVSSVLPGDGATTTAANVAGALRRRDVSVLLIELRLTQPGLLSMLGNPSGIVGLEEALRGKVPLEDCVFQLEDDNLQVLAIDSAMTDEEAGLQSGPLNDLLVWAEDQFDWVVLDCPPVTSDAWTRWFALNADPVLLVARAGDTPMRDLRKASGALKDHLAGVVLNDSH